MLCLTFVYCDELRDSLTTCTRDESCTRTEMSNEEVRARLQGCTPMVLQYNLQHVYKELYFPECTIDMT